MNLTTYGYCHAYARHVDNNGLSRICPLQCEIMELKGVKAYAPSFHCPHYKGRHGSPCPIEDEEITKALENA